ncbi:aspartate kinase [Scopulibacillus daqui]|uniref:Aspartokinase n=1 Tax=Scopulibacillus daqui TaxID=1469162 RepID=A0ABS2PXI4_9BACL|nr:aspartate kinase [Scopulibacillus daqui]MBM7644754.1 aspartate kinase [Scopulibacillus daqui]
MTLTVMKFGGTSVADVEKIRRAAQRIEQKADLGEKLIVVVSAMGKTTDHLVELAGQISARPSACELDMLLSTGEQITSSLLAMLLKEDGYDAAALTGWQAGFCTDDTHGNAKILKIKESAISDYLEDQKIVVVAGFQGISQSGRITTLGRGGSDTSAVALAAAFKADLCEIYTDVAGVFTVDPRYVENARKLDEISYDEMLEMAYLGAGVLHPRAVEYAKNAKVPLIVRSSFTNEKGTVVRESVSMENKRAVKGLAFEKNVAKLTLLGLPDHEDTLSKVFNVLADRQINVDIIIQNSFQEKETNLSFTIDDASVPDAMEALNDAKTILGYSGMDIESDLAKVSIVGSGMASNPGVAAKMFAALNHNGIKVKMVSTSEIKVSAVIDESHLTSSLNVLHRVFELEGAVIVNQ